MRTAIILPLVLTLGACINTSLPKSVSEKAGASTYIPLDPLPTQTLLGASCKVDQYETDIRHIESVFPEKIHNALPDHTVRLSISEFDSSGTLTYGIGSVGFEGKTYQVIIDYMNTDTVRGGFLVKRIVTWQDTKRPFRFGEWKYEEYKAGTEVSIYDKLPPTVYTRYEVIPNPIVPTFADFYGATNVKEGQSEVARLRGNKYQIIDLPIYIGVGARMTANLTVLKGEASLASLPEIAAEVRAGNITGTMIVQTLGATGELVGTNLPLPSEIDRSTIQSAILSVGSIKTLMSGDTIHLTPRVVGFYNTIGGGTSFVNGVISALTTHRVAWHQPCGYSHKKTMTKAPTLKAEGDVKSK